MSLAKEVNQSNEYNEETIRLMRNCVRNADKQVREYCEDIYKSAVVRGRTEFPANHPPIKGIETIVIGMASDADIVRDVCSETHVHLCLASKVYSYSEDAYDVNDIHDVVNQLVVDYIDEKLEYKKDIAFCNPITNNEFYVVDIE